MAEVSTSQAARRKALGLACAMAAGARHAVNAINAAAMKGYGRGGRWRPLWHGATGQAKHQQEAGEAQIGG